MFCPDCGKQSKSGEDFCPSCGYPLYKLEERLKEEEEASLGWAEKIVGKPKIGVKPPPEPPLATFASTPEPSPETDEEKRARTCDICGTEVEYGTHCRKCGDKLPSLMDSDPFLHETFSGLWRMLFGPRFFAQNFPYPVSGGTTQPLLYPGIIAALFVLSVPMASAEKWLGKPEGTLPILVGIAGFILSVIFTPVLVYLSAGFMNIVARVIGRSLPYRRTLRVFASVTIGVLLLGLIINLLRFGLFYNQPAITKSAAQNGIALPAAISWLAAHRELIQAVMLAFGAWMYAWIFGGLFRFSWWKTLILVFATYWLITIVWAAVYVFEPLYFGGLLSVPG
jgi:hypothetical protein